MQQDSPVIMRLLHDSIAYTFTLSHKESKIQFLLVMSSKHLATTKGD
jgi:hypothetical protein